jgi:N-methylhydantoinase B/oxoprolinase/acetone carboxylase alpha subunit
VSNRRDIRLHVMWNRLLAVVEEQAQTLVRTAFSTSTREAGDVSPASSTSTAGCWPRR